MANRKLLPVLSEEEIQQKTKAKKEKDEAERKSREEWQRHYDAMRRAASNIEDAIGRDYFEKFPVCSDQPIPDPAAVAKALFPLMVAFGESLDETVRHAWHAMNENDHDAFCGRHSERHNLTAEQKSQAYNAASFLMERAITGKLTEQDLNHVRDPFVGNLTLHFIRAITKALAGDIALAPASSTALEDTSLNTPLVTDALMTPSNPIQTNDKQERSDTQAGAEKADSELVQYVTLDQMAALVNRTKKTLEKKLNLPNSTMPRPDVEGGGGKAHEWIWTKIRPWLEVEYGKKLPPKYPRLRADGN